MTDISKCEEHLVEEKVTKKISDDCEIIDITSIGRA